MNDIVKQARDYARNLAGPPEDYLVWQLADEIERLEARVTELEESLGHYRAIEELWGLPKTDYKR